MAALFIEASSVIGIGNFGAQSWQLPGQKLPCHLENTHFLLLSKVLPIS